MPTILDATVVASANQTVASARPQRLSNGWIVEVTYNSDGLFYFTVTKDNGVSHIALCKVAGGVIYGGQFFSLTSNGTKLYFLYRFNDTIVKSVSFDATTVTNIDLASTAITVDSSQTAFNGVDMIRNGSYLEGTLASKNGTYPNSFNIRYVKGTIATDGSVTWGAVEQVGIFNNASGDVVNPSLSLDKNGIPMIFVSSEISYSFNGGTGNPNGAYTTIALLKRDKSLLNKGASYLHSSWSGVSVFDSGNTNQTQHSPQGIFIPADISVKINASYTNGLHVVAWHGLDAIDSTKFNIKCRASLDDGITWFDFGVTAEKITSGNVNDPQNVTITVNKKGEIFVLFKGANQAIHASVYQLQKIKYSGGSWGAIQTLSNYTASAWIDPSSLFDLTLNITEPLFIYRDIAKVGFYGTWTITTISVTQGSIGQKTDKSNVLTYAITTDGTMSTITEKVNGVTTGTHVTPTSGQSFIAGLSQAQWDAVKFGKYANATGGANTLTVTMGSEVFTYTFDKRLATDADVLSAVKAVQDADSVYLPSVKSKLVAKVGGVTTDSFETIINGVQLGKKKATGTIMSAASNFNFPSEGGNNVPLAYVALNLANLGFVPGLIRISKTDKTSTLSQTTWNKENFYNASATSYANATYYSSTLRIPYSNGVVNMPVSNTSASFDWVAYEE